MLYKKPAIYYPSLLVEAVLAVWLYHLIGGFWFVYIAILLFDISISLPPRKLIPLLVVVGGLSVAVLLSIGDALLAPVYSLTLNGINIALISLDRKSVV